MALAVNRPDILLTLCPSLTVPNLLPNEHKLTIRHDSCSFGGIIHGHSGNDNDNDNQFEQCFSCVCSFGRSVRKF